VTWDDADDRHEDFVDDHDDHDYHDDHDDEVEIALDDEHDRLDRLPRRNEYLVQGHVVRAVPAHALHGPKRAYVVIVSYEPADKPFESISIA